jgi:DNA-binding NarL/FixJ family response regulator
LSEGEQAEDLYREAIGRLGRCRVALELARARPVYCEWLRRENRRIDARVQLRTAHEMYASMGAEPFTARAARELLATGERARKRTDERARKRTDERARKRTDETRNDLTAQETQIAGLAAEGHTNPEIGAQLFLSPRTVEWHLRKVYTKLGISSPQRTARSGT